MAHKNQKVTLKSVNAEIDNLRKELDTNKKHLSEVKKKLNDAQEEIKDLKGYKCQSGKSESVHECRQCSFFGQTKKILKSHNDKYHPNRIKCNACDQEFKINSDLELHIQTNHDSREKYSCEHCDKQFVLKWRLQKHQQIHTQHKIKKCHYFNNGKICPYENIGCMFEHSTSELCKYGIQCIKNCAHISIIQNA